MDLKSGNATGLTLPFKLALDVTRLKLPVSARFCNKASHTTTVPVNPSTVLGAYFYYFEPPLSSAASLPPFATPSKAPSKPTDPCVKFADTTDFNDKFLIAYFVSDGLYSEIDFAKTVKRKLQFDSLGNHSHETNSSPGEIFSYK